MWTAAYIGHLDIVKYLADKVFAANPMDSRLKFTILSLNPTTQGADVNTPNDGDSPLFMAAQNGHLEVVKYLVEKVFQ